MTKNRICATATGLPKFTRRSLLASVPAIGASTLPTIAGMTKSAADMFPLWLAELDYVNGLDAPTDECLDIACGPMDDLESQILEAPISTYFDLAVKYVVATGFGAHDDNNVLHEAASLLGQSHRVPKWIV